MKKSLLFFTLLAGIAVMAGCKKDQDVVTLKAVVERDTKAYFGPDTYTPYWEAGDKVKINSIEKVLTLPDNPTTYATVRDVTASDYYCAIYPANIVERMGTPTSSGTTATIYFDPHQKYIEKNGHQCVNMPMGAVTNNRDKTFYFKNLCSILRLQVKNTLQTTIKVKRITIYAYGAYLAGSADVTLAPDLEQNGETVITEIRTDGPSGNNVENVLSVYADNGYMKSIAPTHTESFDIVVPPFDANKLNIELEIYDDGDDSEDDNDDTFLGNTDGDIVEPPAVGYNKIINITYENYIVETPDYAYLEPGPDFNTHIRALIGTNNVSTITFHCSWNNMSDLPADDDTDLGEWIVVSEAGSPKKIYARVLNSTEVQVATHADYMYANVNSSHMFENITTVQSVTFHIQNDGTGFQTEDVIDMSYMFKGCTSLNRLPDLEKSNFSNVTNMSHMFENCTGLINFDYLEGINTHNLKNIEAMFKGCANMSLTYPVGMGALFLTSFTTNRVTNMKDFVNGCELLREISIDNAVISDGTELTGAFVNIGGTQHNQRTIYCTQEVETKLRQLGANGNTSVIDLTKVIFKRPSERPVLQ